ncbi:DHHC-type zinc finger family protein [Rhynchospora pubera]|uniref:S-acyltransferase n=1 Tax=Rhynchospora pubera TaxID=906938 RepID=A0AAV8DHT0_9POAL|nr:DHHC-type zinc finger family protein [Rhynchospora pubera]KAJ4766095.1 DHHC-type zinc finger family protein [Rhynchospora pubera]KAJ4818819.1 DHHC-type zinc finger family protein [Rhynchospora pubera]
MQGKLYSTSTRFRNHVSESNRRMVMMEHGHGNSLIRNYQLWRGNNVFWLGGRLIFGPDYRSILLTISLITIPVIFFAVFICKRLSAEVDLYLGHLILSIAVILCIYVITLLILTSSRDPGIVPRNLHPPEPEDDGGVLSPWTTGSQPGIAGVMPAPPLTKDIMINGIIVKVKYCNTCMLYRPPRCSHCSICNNCVERFDHHCPWVGQCIGKRNYRFFFMFVSSTTLLCLYVFTFCWVNLVKLTGARNCTIWRAFLHSPISALLIVYTFIGAWFVGGLTTFHLYLICTNQTTYENFRYRYDGKSNPYNKGCVRNLIEVLFSRTPKSKLNLRGKIQDESVIFASSLSLDTSTVDSGDVAKTSFDLEIAGPADKRTGVMSEEFDDIHAQIENLGKLERCGTQPRHLDTSWEVRAKNGWEMKDDIEALSLEFGMEYGYSDRGRTSREFL